MSMASFHKYILLAIIAIVPILSSAQGSKVKKSAIQHITGQTFISYYNQMNGTPFHQENWSKGDITMKSGETYEDLILGYDEFKDDLIYRNDLTFAIIIVDKESISQFTLKDPNTGKSELFKSIVNEKLKEMSGQFFSIILEDSISVIKKYKATEEMYSNANPTLKKIGKFVHESVLYIWDGKELKNAPKIRSRIWRQYPQYKENIRKFVFRNHIRMKNEDDVKILYQEINRLFKEK